MTRSSEVGKFRWLGCRCSQYQLIRGSLKITAGCALRQIAWRITDSKNEILKVLKQAFYQESDRLVIARIIELISSITIKNLGIRENKDNPDELLGDVDKAIIKTKIFLESI